MPKRQKTKLCLRQDLSALLFWGSVWGTSVQAVRSGFYTPLTKSEFHTTCMIFYNMFSPTEFLLTN